MLCYKCKRYIKHNLKFSELFIKVKSTCFCSYCLDKYEPEIDTKILYTYNNSKLTVVSLFKYLDSSYYDVYTEFYSKTASKFYHLGHNLMLEDDLSRLNLSLLDAILQLMSSDLVLLCFRNSLF